MKYVEDNFINHSFDDAELSWMNALDAIAIDGQRYPIESLKAGTESEEAEEQALLRLAAQLSDTLAPLRELHAPDRAQKQRLKVQLKAALAQKVRRRRWYRNLVIAAAILMFVLLGPGVLLEINLAREWNRGAIGVNEPGRLLATGTPTSGVSVPGYVTSPTRPPTPQSHVTPAPHSRIKLLLPPENMPGVVEVDTPFIMQTNNVLYKYFAHYVVDAQDVFLYEDPGMPPSSPTAFNGLRLISIGSIKGWLGQDMSGRNILNWFQDGFYCQITSSLPISQLANFASHFQVVQHNITAVLYPWG